MSKKKMMLKSTLLVSHFRSPQNLHKNTRVPIEKAIEKFKKRIFKIESYPPFVRVVSITTVPE